MAVAAVDDAFQLGLIKFCTREKASVFDREDYHRFLFPSRYPEPMEASPNLFSWYYNPQSRDVRFSDALPSQVVDARLAVGPKHAGTIMCL